ncbi:hypothetical protein [Robertkochia flava]|uniref:hypothetical protein n=1 Tax=Robertkochia flava TaxID=3447986 RepID=UPI001CCADC7A|nr:hypothetical protein [Robertkochia marina]
MKNVLCFSILWIFLTSCQKNGQEAEPIDFTVNYKFSSEIDQWVKEDTTAWKYQISAVDYATKGDYMNALHHWDLAMGGREVTYTQTKIDSINSLYRQVPAKEYILERAKNERVIIINEAHHSPFHRFFTKSMLQELYDLGYRNLGLEGLYNGTEKDSLLNERGYPVQSSGFYMNEPQFGNLVREAMEIGFHVFPYEQTSGVNNTEREIEQARFIEEFIRSNPDGKFLIHCGYDHAYEGEHGWWGMAMAGRLKEYTGIDPLTINQTLYAEKGDPKFRHPFAKAIGAKKSVVLLDTANQPLQAKSGEAYTDITVFHPNTNYVNERPGWLFNQVNSEQEIDIAPFKLPLPLFVMAFKEGEDIHQAVPVDITEVSKEGDKAILALESGTYTIIVTNKERSFKFKTEVN